MAPCKIFLFTHNERGGGEWEKGGVGEKFQDSNITFHSFILTSVAPTLPLSLSPTPLQAALTFKP